MNDGYYTPKEASEFLRVSVSTLARWRTQISGPIYVKLGERKNSPVRYSKKDLTVFVAVYGMSYKKAQQ
jgi:hypothetical protein